MLFDKVVGGGDETDAGVFANVTLQTQHPDKRVLIQKASNHGELIRIVSILLAKISGSVVAGQDQSKRISSAFARQLHGNIGIDNGARMDRLQRSLKNVQAFQKERALFLEEDREALIGSDNGLICFHLSEVGV